jgi:hypothetical protein
MAQQTINIGTTANDGTGDPLRTAFDKANDNFNEIYANDFVTADRIADNIQLDGTESLGVPSGTTAQRPSVPAAGMFRYNTTDGKFEGYTTEWGEIGGGELSNIYIDTFTGDGSTVAFTASQSIDTENNTQIYIDGVYQAKANYSTSGTTVTFTTAPPNGTAIEMIHVKAIALTTVADGSITNAKMAADSIDSDQYIDGSIDTVHLADDVVSYEKLGARFTDKQDIATTSGTINLDTSLYSIFEITSALTGATTLNIQNFKKGQVIDILVTGAQTITMADDFTTSTINQAGSGVYDGASSNHIQVVCIDDNDSDAILIYSVATYTSDTDPS